MAFRSPEASAYSHSCSRVIVSFCSGVRVCPASQLIALRLAFLSGFVLAGAYHEVAARDHLELVVAEDLAVQIEETHAPALADLVDTRAHGDPIAGGEREQVLVLLLRVQKVAQ